MTALLTVDEALARILERVLPLAVEQVELPRAGGRILAGEIVSPVDLPPFPSSSMDGYAVRAADLPGVLRIVGRVAAGHPESRVLAEGEAIEISTGGVVPGGADTVVPVERVVVRDSEIEGDAAVVSGDNIRTTGGDVRAGTAVLATGDLLTPARLAALAACGVGSVSVRRRPRVAIVVTGSELQPPGATLGPGQIYESNGVMIAAALEEAGAIVERLGVAEDTENAHAVALERALGADVVVTSGGVSVGPHDLVRRVQARLGVDEVFWGVAMRPGKPLAFGVRDRTLVFGLPGNPVSSLVGCLLFVAPALRALQGDPHPAPRFRPGVIAAEVRRRPERDNFVRATTTWTADGAILDPIIGQESHMIVRTTAADAIVHVPCGAEPLPAGGSVRFLQL
jgi:molybdopterin molybdotransferase